MAPRAWDYVYNRFYQLAGEPWPGPNKPSPVFETLLTRHFNDNDFGPGIDAFFFPPESESIQVPDPGFLVGAAGVGLALLSAAAPIVPDWDRALFLSFRESATHV